MAEVTSSSLVGSTPKTSLLQVKREAKLKNLYPYQGLVQQPCSNPGEYPENLRRLSLRKYAYLQVFCKLWKAPAKHRASLTRRGSLVQIQHRPLRKNCVLQVKFSTGGKAVDTLQGLCAAIVQQRKLSGECVLHCASGLVSHAGQHMTIRIHRYRYGCVAQKLLDELRVDVLKQEQGGTSVPEIVEADVGETCLPEERREAPLEQPSPPSGA
jgi:hypothetical protein